MLHHYLVAASRHMLRDRLHTAINILGLAFGMAAAILVGLYVRHELSYDTFLDGAAQIYRIGTQFHSPGRPVSLFPGAPKHAAATLALDFPEFAGVARLQPGRVGLRHGSVEAAETVYWADPGFLSVIGLRVIGGDPAALAAPDAVVLTRSMARKYFGRDFPVGETLEFDHKTAMRVAAVIDDLPSNSHLKVGIIASGLAPRSTLAREDAEVPAPGAFGFGGYIYVRVRAGAPPPAADRLAAFVRRHFADDDGGTFFDLTLDPVSAIHLMPYEGDMKEAADPRALTAVGLIGLIILGAAGVNFASLMTAQAARRGVEVGIRMATGASRRQILTQFVSEAMAIALIATALASALVELALPSFNAAMDRLIGFAYWRDPVLAGALLAALVAMGIVAGFYPALRLARLAPATALKSGHIGVPGGFRLRSVLVVLQFSVSIGLTVATIVILRQTEFATGKALHLDTADVVAIQEPRACIGAFRARVAALPGVRGAACSLAAPLSFAKAGGTAMPPGGRELGVDLVDVDFGFLELYGVAPLAGRTFDRARGADVVDPAAPDGPAVAINQTAAHALGFASPAEALGQTIEIAGIGRDKRFSSIIAVVPDFPIGTVRELIAPSIFYVDPAAWRMLSVKLDPAMMPETLAAIDRFWDESGAEVSVRRSFVATDIGGLYRDMAREGVIFAAFALVAIAIGCLGLFGLSAFTAERRTKEIGIRKALGASSIDVARLLVWQFMRPVLVANAIAWPVAWFAMRRWLEGFAYHIELGWQPFALAGAAALVIAVATTLFHAFQVARARPVLALRYE